MRTSVLFLAAIGAAGCGSGDRRASEPRAAATASRGPDAVVLRVPRAGGRLRAALYPQLDSVVWRSADAAPPLARVLAFDPDGGQLAVVDSGGAAMRIDLRLGTVRRVGKERLRSLASGDGSAIFGIAADGSIVRETPSGDRWRVALSHPVEVLVPQRGGAVLAAGAGGGTGYVWLLHPPTTRASDSAVVTGAARAVLTGAADRVYFTAGSELVGVRSRDLEPLAPVTIDAPVRAVAATPSGDRMYVVTARAGALLVVNRFTDEVTGRVALPGPVSALRMDPLGRYLLARVADADSAWVIAVGTDRALGIVRGAWREDLPLVLPDGAIASAVGADVGIVDGETLRAQATVAGGAADLWHVVQWNGFRPRAAGLDQPVTFGGAGGARDSAAGDSAGVAIPADSGAPPVADTLAPIDPAPPDSIAASPTRRGRFVTTRSAGEVALAVSTAGTVQRGRGYTVQFAAAGSEREARTVVTRLKVDGPPVRVVPAERGGKTLYRVVMGPFPSRVAAERAARKAGGSFWIYEGVP